MRDRSTTRIAGLCLAAVSTVGLTVLAASSASAAEGQILGADSPTAIDGSYVVVLKDGATASIAGQYGGAVDQVFSSALNGFSASMSEDAAKRLAADPNVAFVQQNQMLSITTDQPNPPSWGQDRVDQADLPLDKNYSYATTASNVTAYVIDTGIAFDHPDFGGRAISGRDTVDNDNDATDCHGHGTHVAGTIGGTDHGLAKEVKLVSVRVLDCGGWGSSAQVLAGVDWVTANAQKPAVANMSLSGNPDAAVDAAVQESIASGVTYAIASGNSNTDACKYSPARVPEAITVNATDDTDARAHFSNYGSCTDIFAPGRYITSDWLDGGTNTISGTSMAAPHVAGAAALYLADHPDATPAAVGEALIAAGGKDKVSDPGSDSPNVLLYTGADGTDPGPQPGGCAAKANQTRSAIPDAGAAVTSTVEIAGCDGTAAPTTNVTVAITHTYRGQLRIDLVAPDGTSYRLKNTDPWDSADNVNATYTVDASAKNANGTWTLKVQDVYRFYTGTLDSWTIDV